MNYHCLPGCFYKGWPHHRYSPGCFYEGWPHHRYSPGCFYEGWPHHHHHHHYSPGWPHHHYSPGCVVNDNKNGEKAGYSANFPSSHSNADNSGSIYGETWHSNLMFLVFSYNILSESHATNDSYHRHKLLCDIVGTEMDIICLQEVQMDHFKEFFKPEMDKHGYEALFKQKSTEGFSDDERTLNGCATFFRKDKFSLVQKYEVEFNKAARSFIDATLPAAKKKPALERMITDNVALILVLEAKLCFQGSNEKPQRVCVANTHIDLAQELKDVQLWQVNTLMKELEKHAHLPMLVCGDFLSLHGSTLHALLATGKIDPKHPDMEMDPLGILQYLSKLSHLPPLVSAHSSFVRTGDGAGSDLEKKMVHTTNEPFSTNYNTDIIGTRHYIFYFADSLTVDFLLGTLRKDTPLPSLKGSPDHIAVLARFRWKLKSKI